MSENWWEQYPVADQSNPPLSPASPPAASASAWWEQFPVAAEQSAAPMSRAEQQIPGVSRLLESSNPTDSQRLGDTGITPGTAMEFAALHVDRVQQQRQAASQPGLSQQEQVAIADIYKKAAGQSGDLSNQNFYQQVQQKRFAERGETYAGRTAEAGLKAVNTAAQPVLSLIKTVAPETGNRLGEDVNAIAGTDPRSWAAYAGGKGMEVAQLAGLMATGGTGMGVVYGAESFGSVRGEAAKLREQGTPVSATKEYTLALTSGGINGLVGAIANKIFGNSSSFVTKAVQDELLMGAQTVINNKIQGGMDKQTAWYQGLLETALTAPLFTLAGTAAARVHEGVREKQGQPVAPTTESPVETPADKAARYIQERAADRAAETTLNPDYKSLIPLEGGNGLREKLPTATEPNPPPGHYIEEMNKQLEANKNAPPYEFEMLPKGGNGLTENAPAPETPAVETQSQMTNEPIRKNVGNFADPGTKVEWTDAQGNAKKGVYEVRAVDGGHWVIDNGQRSKVADVTVAADQGKPSLEQRAKPVIPDEARDWSYTKLKGWARANGYDISAADNIRSLRLRVAEQRGDSLTDLPQRPSKSGLWNARRLRYWAEANGYTIPGEAKYPVEIRNSLDAQRSESIARGKEALGQINKGPGERKALPELKALEAAQNAPETPEQRTVREATVKASIAKALKEKPNEIRAIASQVQGSAGKMFAPMGARIEDLSPAIFGRIKKREFDTNTATERGQRESLPLMEQLTAALGGRGSAKYNEFSRLIQSQKFDAAKALLPEGARVAVDQLSAIRRRVFEEARANGVDAGDIGNDHWPRFVKDLATLQASVGTEEKGQIEAAWEQAERNRGGPLQTAEKMEIANKVTAGYGPKKPGAVGPPNARERRIGELTIDQVPLYGDVFESHMKYLEQMITAGERAKFLGKSDDPSKLKESVGKLVYDEITAGRMKPEHQAEMTGLLQTLLTGESARASKGNRIATQLIHLATLGQLRTAFNQVIDTSFATGMYGFKSAGEGVKAALGLAPADRTVAMREVGLNDRGTEFREVGKLARAVGWVMEHTGLSRFDRFSKELVMSAAHDRYQRVASDPAGKGYKSFERKYKPLLGEAEFNKTVADYKSGEKTARTGFVEFVEVGRVQPTSLMSMPEAYIKNPNLRILYTLRSFQISQLSFVAREGVRKLGSKVPGERAEGVKTLARFATTMLLANVGKDLLYKFLHGETVKPEDLPLAAVNSLLGLVGLSTYALKQASTDPVGAALRFVSPPVGFVTDIWKDLTGQSWGKGSRAVRYIPLAGDALYYWAPFGHGYHAKKEVAKADFNASLMDMRRRAYTAYSGGDPGTARAWMDKHNDLLPKGEKKMVFSDVQFPPRDTSERAASKSRMEQATGAYKSGDMNAADRALAEENQNRRPSARKTRRDLEKSIERAKARGE